MTGYEIIVQAWRESGKPTNLDPTTVATTQLEELIDVFNEHAPYLAKWKDPVRGRQLRLRHYETSEYHKLAPYTCEVVSVSTDKLDITVDTLSSGFPADITGCVISDPDSNVRFCYDYDATDPYVISVETALSDIEADDELDVYVPWITLSSNRFQEVLFVEDITNKTPLSRVGQFTTRINSLTNVSDPTEWKRVGNKILFNNATDNTNIYHVQYERLPNLWVYASDNDGDNIDLPVLYHQPMVMLIASWIYMRRQEPEMAEKVRSEFDRMMRSLQSPDDMYNASSTDSSNTLKVRLS